MTNNDNITMTTEQRPTSMITDHGSRINKQGILQILISPGAPGLITERQRRAAYRRRPACPERRQDARPTNYARAPLPYSPNSSRHQPRPPVTCNLSPVTSSRPRRAAFSLAEILIAIFVLSIGLIMIAAVFPVAAKWTAQDAQTSIAQVIAKNAVAQIRTQFLAGAVLPLNTTAQPFTGYGPFVYSFGNSQPLQFGTHQAFTATNYAPFPVDPAPAAPTPAPVPPPGSYYWSAVIVPATSGYAGVAPFTTMDANSYTIYLFVFNKGEQSNTFAATAPNPSFPAGNTLLPMLPDAQNSVPSFRSFYPQLFEGEYKYAAPAMPVDSLGVDVNTGGVFRLITDPATNALVPTGLAGGSVINRTSDYVIFAPPAIGQTSSPLIYVYVTTVNL